MKIKGTYRIWFHLITQILASCDMCMKQHRDRALLIINEITNFEGDK